MSGNDNANKTLVYGWVSSPNSRGTMDIIQICLITVFLCTYTTLFLNIKPKKSLLGQVLYKSKWAAFTVFFPEVIMAMAGEQWRSTVQSVEEFTQLRRRLEEAQSDPEKVTEVRDDTLLSRLQTTPWTAQHAFLADMGGLRIQFPDFKAIPVKAYQFFWLVENRHISYLEVGQQVIWDKNKADVFVRGLTLFQLIWFTVQSIARGVQHLDLTTLELSTLAFAFCTIHTFWFWRNKPLDIEEPITLKCEEKTLAEIVKETGQAIGLYTRTPLDFLEPGPRINYIDAWFWAINLSFGLDHKPAHQLPVATFSNIDMIPPRGIRLTDIFFALIFIILYFAIHLAAWVFPFPTAIEHHLWRIAAMVMAGLSIVTMLGAWPGSFIGEGLSPPGEKWTIKEAAMLLPRWALRMIFLPVIAAYLVCRTYVIVEGFASLRALPASAFESVNWWGFVPHF